VKRAKADINIFGKAGSRDIAVFCRQLSVLLNAGVTIIESITILKGHSDSKKLNGVIDGIHDRLQRGVVLSDAMSEHDEIGRAHV
jgi:type IV pilus assembly protein PilC